MSDENSQIEAYCSEMSTAPSPLCEELAAYTRANVDMSIMLCGPIVGSLLGLYVRSTAAKRVLEIGTYTGYSALAMAERLPAGGELITLDVNPRTTEIAQRFWDKSPHGKKIHSKLGPGAETLAALKGPFDFVFIDANKPGYIEYFDRVLPLVRPGGVIAADNCLYSQQVILENPPEENGRAIKAFNAHVKKTAGIESVLLPIRDGVHVITKLARD